MSVLKTEPEFSLPTTRVETLADGVFAIVMTLLILEIKVPELADAVTTAEMLDRLSLLWPKFLCYLISFVTLGVYWVAHHLHFYYIKRADRMLLWINILFLMTIGVIPFTTALLGEYYSSPLAVSLYGANMVAVGLTLQLHWSYSTHRRRHVNAAMTDDVVRTVNHVIMTGPAIYAVAILLAWGSPIISLVMYLAVNLVYILPGGAHFFLKGTLHSAVRAPEAHAERKEEE